MMQPCDSDEARGFEPIAVRTTLSLTIRLPHGRPSVGMRIHGPRPVRRRGALRARMTPEKVCGCLAPIAKNGRSVQPFTARNCHQSSLLKFGDQAELFRKAPLSNQAQPNSLMARVSFQILVIWLIFSPSNSMA